jgi:hypothetical protein
MSSNTWKGNTPRSRDANDERIVSAGISVLPAGTSPSTNRARIGAGNREVIGYLFHPRPRNQIASAFTSFVSVPCAPPFGPVLSIRQTGSGNRLSLQSGRDRIGGRNPLGQLLDNRSQQRAARRRVRAVLAAIELGGQPDD